MYFAFVVLCVYIFLCGAVCVFVEDCERVLHALLQQSTWRAFS